MLYNDIPKKMKALYYEKPKDFSIQEIDVPKLRSNDILMKVLICGVCGTDLHVHDGEFISKFPLVPGHEAIGVVAAMGEDVTGFSIGDKICADNSELDPSCHYCRRGAELFCEDFNAHGVSLNGAFAEYCAYPCHKIFKIPEGLKLLDAALLEAASCAMHGIRKVNPGVGSTCLVLGAGPTGQLLAQLLKHSGCAKVVVAAPAGNKLELARKLKTGDKFYEIDREDFTKTLDELKKDFPFGFDIVVEATGRENILQDSIDLVTRGGKLMCYGVYSDAAKVEWKPTKIFGDEITIVGSFSQTYEFPSTLNFFQSDRLNLTGMINKTFRLEQWAECLESIRKKEAIKAVVVLDPELELK